ncbi:MAG TPA: Hsp20/alpha crystallin family protein [Candidatus Marinimicrobia bacterium]|nr:Hsp20/alpha crystallin family protein [Candidatus Neomarinimicrobiota bacterium]
MTLINRRINNELMPSLNEVFESFLSDVPSRMNPRMDLEETSTQYNLRLELPGMSKENVQISFEDSMLVVNGEKKEPVRQKENRYHYSEIVYGKFSRAIKVPTNVESDKISANFENGILTITIPKSEQAKPRKIEIL